MMGRRSTRRATKGRLGRGGGRGRGKVSTRAKEDTEMSEDEVEVIEQSEKDDRKKESEEYSEKEIEEIERKGMPTLESIKAAIEWKVPEKLEHLLKVTKELMRKINNEEWEKEGEKSFVKELREWKN